MRILQVSHAFLPDSWAGVELHTAGLSRALARRGHEVAVLTRAPDGPDFTLADSRFEDLPVYRLSKPTHGDDFETTFHDPRVEAPFREALARFRPDFVHFQHVLHLSGHLPSLVASLGLRCALTFHDYWYFCGRVNLGRPGAGRCPGPTPLRCARCLAGQPALQRSRELLEETRARLLGWSSKRQRGLADPELMALLERRGEHFAGWLADIDVLIANSAYTKRRYLDHFGWPAERVVHVPYAVDVSPFSRRVRRSEEPGVLRLGFVGSVAEHKGLHVLLEAIRGLEGVSVDVHGSHGGNARAAGYMSALPRPANVRFNGAYRPVDLPEIFAHLDAVVVPSIWHETWGLVADEAQLAGVPVVASRAGGLPEHIEHEKNGLLFRLGDTVDLRRQIERLLAEPHLLEHLRSNAGGVRSLDDYAADLEPLYAGPKASRG